MSMYHVKGVFIFKQFVSVDKYLEADDEEEAVDLASEDLKPGDAFDNENGWADNHPTVECVDRLNDLGDLMDLYGVESLEQLDRQVYKQTSCGAWVREIEGGVRVGTIVEGHDAEFDESLTFPFTVDDWHRALQGLEDAVEEYLNGE